MIDLKINLLYNYYTTIIILTNYFIVLLYNINIIN